MGNTWLLIVLNFIANSLLVSKTMSTEPKVIVLNTTQTKISEQNRTTDGIAALIASLSDFEGTPEPKQEPYRKSSENLASKQGRKSNLDRKVEMFIFVSRRN